MFDDVVVVYRILGDLLFYVTGDQDENEVGAGDVCGVVFCGVLGFCSAHCTAACCAAAVVRAMHRAAGWRCPALIRALCLLPPRLPARAQVVLYNVLQGFYESINLLLR